MTTHVILAAHHVLSAAQDHAQNHAASLAAQDLYVILAATTKSSLLVCCEITSGLLRGQHFDVGPFLNQIILREVLKKRTFPKTTR